MSDPARDLTGDWTGIYNYPKLLPPTPFEVSLRDHDGRLTGLTTEPDHGFGGIGITLHAIIEGTREGSAVRFTKSYDDFEMAPDAVLYEGKVQAGGDEIAGRWTIPGAWSGTFIMIRGSRAGTEVEQHVSEKV